MQHALWPPPTLWSTRRESDLWNAMLSYGGQPLSLDGSDRTITFDAIDPPESTRHSLLIQPDNGPRFITILTSFPFEAMFNADIEIADIQKLPLALRNCLEEGVVATLWTAIPNNRMGGFRIICSGQLSEISQENDPTGWRWLSIAIGGIAPNEVTALIGLPVIKFIDAVADGALATASVELGLKAALTSEASYTLGHLILSIDALGQLASGDVVVLAELSPPELTRIRIDQTCFTFQPAEEGWVCIRRETREDSHLPLGTSKELTIVNNDTVDSAELSLGALNITIDFDLSRMTFALSEIETWQPGMIVTLDPPALKPGGEVTIRANGQVIGTGDLVRIDERIAVRITRLMFKN